MLSRSMKFPSRNSLPVFRGVRSHHSLNHLECGYLKSKRAWSALASPWRITITSAWRSLCQTKYPEAAPPSVAPGHGAAARRLARLWSNQPAPARGTQRTRICGYHPNRRHRIGIDVTAAALNNPFQASLRRCIARFTLEPVHCLRCREGCGPDLQPTHQAFVLFQPNRESAGGGGTGHRARCSAPASSHFRLRRSCVGNPSLYGQTSAPVARIPCSALARAGYCACSASCRGHARSRNCPSER